MIATSISSGQKVPPPRLISSCLHALAVFSSTVPEAHRTDLVHTGWLTPWTETSLVPVRWLPTAGTTARHADHAGDDTCSTLLTTVGVEKPVRRRILALDAETRAASFDRLNSAVSSPQMYAPAGPDMARERPECSPRNHRFVDACCDCRRFRVLAANEQVALLRADRIGAQRHAFRADAGVPSGPDPERAYPPRPRYDHVARPRRARVSAIALRGTRPHRAQPAPTLTVSMTRSGVIGPGRGGAQLTPYSASVWARWGCVPCRKISHPANCCRLGLL